MTIFTRMCTSRRWPPRAGRGTTGQCSCSAATVRRVRLSMWSSTPTRVGCSTASTTTPAGATFTEIRLLILPILTGTGRRLTPEVGTSTGMDLQEVREWPAGVVELRYSLGS